MSQMKRLHIALALQQIILKHPSKNYSTRLGTPPCSYVSGEYALWRTECLNVSIRQDENCKPGELRHLGFEDSTFNEFSQDTDVNAIVWERFSAKQQADEINEVWPEANYSPKD